jgi:GNAT superfamily N-acetyltransferase
MSEDDLKIAVKFAANEGWNPGLNDQHTFWQADPGGFFKGVIDNEIISTISGVTYGDAFAFIGLYITKSAYRGKGYGTRIMRKCLDYIDNRNCGLDGVIAMVHKYEEFGFTSACRNTRFIGKANIRSIPKHISDQIIDLTTLDFSLVQQFDSKIFSTNRSRFLKSWISQPNAYARALVQNRSLLGYYLARPCLEGFKIGPLFAQDQEIASYLLDDAGNHVAGSKIMLDVLGANHKAYELAKSRGLLPDFQTERMYTKSDPLKLSDHIFGITSFELG